MNNNHNNIIDFIGIGVQKAGTTWLYKCLSEHPEICMSEPKETEFFTRDKPLQEYEQHFTHCANKHHRIRGEFSPRYFPHAEVPQRIHHCAPDIKFILILRDPTERLISHYTHNTTKGVLDAHNVAEAIAQKPQRREIGLYAHHLSRWLTFFSIEQFHILLYEDIEKKPQEVLRNIYTFLGVTPSFSPPSLTQRYNTSSARSTIFFWMKRSIYLRLRQYTIGRYILRILRIVRIPHLFHSRSRTHTKEILACSKETKEQLRLYYVEDIRLLETYINRNLDTWLPASK